jgi:protein-S-isoprenylcysteine O-methyltransferase Ste14
MIPTGLFILLSILLLAFTLSRPHKHRFYRFLAFECLLGLVIINSGAWFKDPSAPLQLISWISLIGSLMLALHGFRLLRSLGAPSGDIENTTRLVTSGAYRYIRHPLYSSLLLLGVGAFLKQISFLSASLLLGLVIFIFLTARVEEADNLARFGEPYREYMSQTKMFVPFLI